MTSRLFLASIALLGASSLSEAAAQQVTRAVKGDPGKDIRVGVYVNVKSDCSSGPLPTIRLVDRPSNGKVTVRSANVKAQNYKQCLALEVPGYVAFYRSEPTFSGVDSFTIEVKFPEGRTELQKLNVTVGSTPQERKT
jgi:hypothetical protein